MNGPGTKDGQGAADNDKPYTFGRHPLTYMHARDFVRLLVRFPRREPRPVEQRADD